MTCLFSLEKRRMRGDFIVAIDLPYKVKRRSFYALSGDQ